MISSPHPADPGQANSPADDLEAFPARLPRAEWAFKLRRMRDRIFGSELFGEPSWDALLLLATAQESGEKLTAARIALELHLPREVAMRTVGKLAQAGLVAAAGIAHGDFSVPVALTDEGQAKLLTVLG